MRTRRIPAAVAVTTLTIGLSTGLSATPAGAAPGADPTHPVTASSTATSAPPAVAAKKAPPAAVKQGPAPNAARPAPAAVAERAAAHSAENSCAETRRRMARQAKPASSRMVCVEPGPGDRARLRSTLAAADIEPVPTWCEEHAFEGLWLTRDDACEISDNTVFIYETYDSDVVVGSISYFEIHYQYTYTDDLLWGEQVQLLPYDADGVGENGAFLQGARGVCFTGECAVVSVDFPDQVFAVGEVLQGEAFFTTPVTEVGSVSMGQSIFTWQLTNPDWNVWLLVLSGLGITVRCDNLLAPARPGCVYPDYPWSTMVYSLSGPYPELAAHIMEAQLSGLPGAYPGYGPNTEPLHRIQAPLLVERNRETACPLERDGGYPRPPGKSCDEYPFASTAEGAFTGGGHARTFPWCQITQPGGTGPTGYSVCMIDLTQNTEGGRMLNEFYLTSRIIEFDEFYVYIAA